MSPANFCGECGCWCPHSRLCERCAPGRLHWSERFAWLTVCAMSVLLLVALLRWAVAL